MRFGYRWAFWLAAIHYTESWKTSWDHLIQRTTSKETTETNRYRKLSFFHGQIPRNIQQHQLNVGSVAILRRKKPFSTLYGKMLPINPSTARKNSCYNGITGEKPYDCACAPMRSCYLGFIVLSASRVFTSRWTSYSDSSRTNSEWTKSVRQTFVIFTDDSSAPIEWVILRASVRIVSSSKCILKNGWAGVHERKQ